MLKTGPPLAIALKPQFWTEHCHYCLKPSTDLKRCSACLGTFYCSIDCQKADWQHLHSLECKSIKRFQREFDKEACKNVDALNDLQRKLNRDLNNESLPNMLCQRVNGENNAALAVLIYRIFLLSENGRLAGVRGPVTDRGFSDLMTHEEDFRKSPAKAMIFRVLSSFICTELLPGADAQAIYKYGSTLFDIFCKVLINSHSLYHWDSQGDCHQVALALCLDVSAYDHACSPTAELRSEGRNTVILAMKDGFDIKDTTKTFIPYVNLMSQKDDRQKFLKDNYFFDCHCQLCEESSDNWKTAISCKQCSRVVPIQVILGGSGDGLPEQSPTCEHCDTVQPDSHTRMAVQVMKSLRRIVGGGIPQETPPEGAELEKLMELEQQAAKYLSKNNIYYGYLLEAMRDLPQITQKMKTKSWLGYYVILKCCYPENSARMVIPEAIQTAKTLCLDGDFKIARQILLNLVFKNAANYFGENRSEWPFRRLTDYLEICCREEKVPVRINDYL